MSISSVPFDVLGRILICLPLAEMSRFFLTCKAFAAFLDEQSSFEGKLLFWESLFEATFFRRTAVDECPLLQFKRRTREETRWMHGAYQMHSVLDGLEASASSCMFLNDHLILWGTNSDELLVTRRRKADKPEKKEKKNGDDFEIVQTMQLPKFTGTLQTKMHNNRVYCVHGSTENYLSAYDIEIGEEEEEVKFVMRYSIFRSHLAQSIVGIVENRCLWGISLSHDGSKLVCGDNMGFLLVFDSDTGDFIREIDAKLFGGVFSLKCLKSGTVVAASFSGILATFSEEGHLLNKIQLEEKNEYIRTICVVDDLHFILGTNFCQIQLRKENLEIVWSYCGLDRFTFSLQEICVHSNYVIAVGVGVFLPKDEKEKEGAATVPWADLKKGVWIQALNINAPHNGERQYFRDERVLKSTNPVSRVYSVDMRDGVIITACGSVSFALVLKVDKPKKSMSQKLLRSLKLDKKDKASKTSSTNTNASSATDEKEKK